MTLNYRMSYQWIKFLELFSEKNRHLSRKEVVEAAKEPFKKLKKYYKQIAGNGNNSDQDDEKGVDISDNIITAYDINGVPVDGIKYDSCSVCSSPPCPAYLDPEYSMAVYYKDIVKNSKDNDDIYVISFVNGLGSRFCIDIRNVVNEVESGKHTYFLGSQGEGGEFLYYFDNIVFDRLVEKERAVLETDRIFEKKQSYQELIYPSGAENARKRHNRKIIFIGLMLLIKVYTAMDIGSIIIAYNLSRPLREIYEQTTEYKKAQTKTVEDAMGHASQYNPFDAQERNIALSAAERGSNNSVMDRAFSARLAQENNRIFALEDRILNPAFVPLGIQRKEEIMNFLDQDINVIRAHSTQCLFTKIVMLESEHIKIEDDDSEEDKKTKMIEKIRITNEFLKLITSNSGRTIISELSGIYGSTCMRNIGRNLVRIAEKMKTWFPDIPELDLSRKITPKEIPKEIRSCFFNLLTKDDRHGKNLNIIIQLIEIDR